MNHFQIKIKIYNDLMKLIDDENKKLELYYKDYRLKVEYQEEFDDISIYVVHLPTGLATEHIYFSIDFYINKNMVNLDKLTNVQQKILFYQINELISNKIKDIKTQNLPEV